MATEPIFQTHLVLGYLCWLLCCATYILPWLNTMDPAKAQRAIAMLHSFRFFGLVFILPGVVGPDLPASFAAPAAYGDLATGLFAMLAVAVFRVRPVFWLLVVTFNLVGLVDLVTAYYHAIQAGLPARAGQLGAAYAIPILYVPLLMITHLAALWLLVRPHRAATQTDAGRIAVTGSR